MDVIGHLHAPANLSPGKELPVGGWVGPRTSLDMVSKRKIPSPRRESNPDHPIVQPIASRYTDRAIPAHAVKVKVKLSMCFNWAPRHGGVLGEWRYSSTHSLTSTLDGGEWSASRSAHFTLRKRASSTHWIGSWVGPRAVLDVVVTWGKGEMLN
jgi:hypothetical protein